MGDLPHRLRRRAACITAATLALALTSPARAERVIVADFYGEADVRESAGAVTLLVRSMLGGGAEIVPRAELVAATPPGSSPLGRIDEVLAATKATAIIVGDVSRRGVQLRVSARILRAGGASGGVASAIAGDGHLHALALAVATQLAPELGAEVRERPGASLGRLRRFAAADAALRAGDPATAARHIDTADALAAGRVPAAREVAAAIAADPAQPLPVRIQAALVAVDPDGALALAAQAAPGDAAAAVGAARAHLARMNVKGATDALAPLGDSSDPVVLAARAELDHARTRFEQRDALLTRALAGAPDVHVLVAIADLPTGALSAAVETASLTAAEGIDPGYRRTRAAIGLRVAHARPPGADLARALALISVTELDESELEMLRPLVAAAPAGPETHRLAAELAIWSGDVAAGRKAADAWLASRPASAGAQILIGRLHAQASRPAKAADFLGKALAGGAEEVRREQAMALVAAGNLAAARAHLVHLEDPSSVDARVIAGLTLLTEGKADEAVSELERAVALSPASADAHRALARALDRAGRTDAGPHRALADQLDRIAGVTAAAVATAPPKGKKKTDIASGEPEEKGFLDNAMVIATAASILAVLIAGVVWVMRRRRAAAPATAPAPAAAGPARRTTPLAMEALQRSAPGTKPTTTPFAAGSIDLAHIQVTVMKRGVPQNGAQVWIDGVGRPAYTDADGRVTLRVALGDHTLCIDSAGATHRQPLEVPSTAPQAIPIDIDARSKVNVSEGIDVVPDESLELGEIERSPERPATVRMPKILADGTAPGPPSSFGKYEIVAELGRGAMGIVFRARDRNLERDVALKLIGDEVRNHPMALEMFLQEAKALAQLNHPNIVSVYDQNEQDGLQYMVMEFVEGQTLEKILADRGRLTLTEVLDIADQVASGLAYAHERRVIHRDIKPANIFIANDGAVKLGDFGLARVMREISIRKTEVRGTPLYMAPEQITGTDVNHRADLYALGCTMFEMCTGRPPFIDGDLLYHHLNTEPPHPADLSDEVPRELDALIVECIAKDSTVRIASASAIRERLRPIRNRYG